MNSVTSSEAKEQCEADECDTQRCVCAGAKWIPLRHAAYVSKYHKSRLSEVTCDIKTDDRAAEAGVLLLETICT